MQKSWHAQRIVARHGLLEQRLGAHLITMTRMHRLLAHTAIGKTLNMISNMSSHFYTSGQRTNALKRISKEKNLHLLMLSKLFTVRWTEFSCTIINNLLLSWHVLMIYLDAKKKANATEIGYYKFRSKLENLKVITFLADLLQMYIPGIIRKHKTRDSQSLASRQATVRFKVHWPICVSSV